MSKPQFFIIDDKIKAAIRSVNEEREIFKRCGSKIEKEKRKKENINKRIFRTSFLDPVLREEIKRRIDMDSRDSRTKRSGGTNETSLSK